MMGFDFYLMRFIEEHPEKRKDVAEFVYNSPFDSYFGQIGELAKANGINLYEADVEIWGALINPSEKPRS